MAKGLDGRQRDEDVRVRKTRRYQSRDAAKEYGENFAKGYRSDTKLETLREKTGKSLSELSRKRNSWRFWGYLTKRKKSYASNPASSYSRGPAYTLKSAFHCMNTGHKLY